MRKYLWLSCLSVCLSMSVWSGRTSPVPDSVVETPENLAHKALRTAMSNVYQSVQGELGTRDLTESDVLARAKEAGYQALNYLPRTCFMMRILFEKIQALDFPMQEVRENLVDLEKLVDFGIPEVAFILGGILAEERDDYVDAAKLFRQAADQDLVDAQYVMGALYKGGRGVPLDPKKAAFWYERAAEQGHALAQGEVAKLYLDGEWVERNLKKALEFCDRAACHADPDMQDELSKRREQITKALQEEQV